MSVERRVFYAHARMDDDDAINAACVTLRRLLGGANEAAAVRVVAGRDDFTARSKAAGGWAGWVPSIAGTVMGEPRYHAIVVPATLDNRPVCGKATGQIVGYAIQASRKVLLWDGGTVFQRVVGVRCDDGKDYQTGWTLVVGA